MDPKFVVFEGGNGYKGEIKYTDRPKTRNKALELIGHEVSLLKQRSDLLLSSITVREDKVMIRGKYISGYHMQAKVFVYYRLEKWHREKISTMDMFNHKLDLEGYKNEE